MPMYCLFSFCIHGLSFVLSLLRFLYSYSFNPNELSGFIPITFTLCTVMICVWVKCLPSKQPSCSPQTVEPPGGLSQCPKLPPLSQTHSFITASSGDHLCNTDLQVTYPLITLAKHEHRILNLFQPNSWSVESCLKRTVPAKCFLLLKWESDIVPRPCAIV